MLLLLLLLRLRATDAGWEANERRGGYRSCMYGCDRPPLSAWCVRAGGPPTRAGSADVEKGWRWRTSRKQRDSVEWVCFLSMWDLRGSSPANCSTSSSAQARRIGPQGVCGAAGKELPASSRSVEPAQDCWVWSRSDAWGRVQTTPGETPVVESTKNPAPDVTFYQERAPPE